MSVLGKKSYQRDVYNKLQDMCSKRDSYHFQDIGADDSGNKLCKIVIGSYNDYKMDVLITAGSNGDQSAGVRACVKLIKNLPYRLKRKENDLDLDDCEPMYDNPVILDNQEVFNKSFNINWDAYRLHIIPCINPWGYNRNKHNNKKRQDVSRNFVDDTKCLEARLVMDAIQTETPYTMAIDLHEHHKSVPYEGRVPQGFYLHETNFNIPRRPIAPGYEGSVISVPERIGSEIISGVNAKKFPVCVWDKIFGDEMNKGVVSLPQKNHTETGLHDYVIDKGLTKHALTFATPAHWRIRSWRKNAMITAIGEALSDNASYHEYDYANSGQDQFYGRLTEDDIEEFNNSICA